MAGRPDKEIVVCHFIDPTGDQVFPLFRAPVACTIEAAHACFTDAFNATDSVDTKLALYNGGTVGTAETVMSGTIGGTAGTPSWTALKMETFSISAGTLAAGEVVTLDYDETGANSPGSPLMIQLDIAY